MIYFFIFLFIIYKVQKFIFIRFFNIFSFSDNLNRFFYYFLKFLHIFCSSDSIFLYKKIKNNFYLLSYRGDINSKNFNSDFFVENKIKLFKSESYKFILINIKLSLTLYFIIEINLKKFSSFKFFILKMIVNIINIFIKILFKFIMYPDIEIFKYIGTIINMKYNIMGEHTENTVYYCKKLLLKLDISKYNIPNVRVFKKEMLEACYVHDLGKIGIEDKILNKKTPLTEGEWSLIKRHPVIGFEIISKINFFEYIPNVVLYHHERFDGKGYPEGLLGEKIPIEARIFSVIDAFDAMTSNRGYKENISKEKALEELKREKGKQFDPFIVDVFCEYLEANI